jgi:dienelactone hydrolase
MKRPSSLAVLCLLVLGARAADAAPMIVAPTDTLQDAAVRIRVDGLVPGARYDVRSDFAGHGGSVWRSRATFVADGAGMIDLGTAAPVAGSWSAADAQAYLWAMEKTTELAPTMAVVENDDRSIVTVKVFQDTTVVAEKRITFLKRASGVSMTDFRDGIVGTLYTPYGKRNVPAVIVLGGSEGGTMRDRAAMLASHGYAALALGYFGAPGLPQELDRIPVETVTRAVEWLKNQPMVDAKKVALFGGSKGAELALVAASRDRDVRAVVALAPSSVVYQSITGGRELSSSWSAGGKQLPYAPYVSSEAFSKSHRLIDLYEPTLAAAPAAAAIEVENINGPVLLIAGQDDALWPSAKMAEQLVARAKSAGFKPRIVSLTIAAAGHHVANVPNRPTGDSVRLGGTAAGLAAAQFQSWRAILEFLAESLRGR